MLSFPHHRRLLRVIIAICWALDIAAAAQAQPRDGSDASAAPEAGTTRQEILHALHDVQEKYGADAVLMEGHLLGETVRNGSITTAEISIPGYEERDGKRYLAFRVDTGIVYNDRELGAAARPVRLWNDVVERTLRKFHALSVQADGVVLQMRYAHKLYDDELELRTHLSQAPGESEAAAFYLLSADVAELIAEHISGQQLIDRSTVLINGAPTRLQLQTTAATP